MARKYFPDVKQYAVICNPAGKLTQLPNVSVAQLNPATNDQSLVMTSSFSNLVLAGLSLTRSDHLQTHIESICERVRDKLPSLASLAAKIAEDCPGRVAALASPPLFPWAQEASLKILEMTSGKIPTLAETYLGLRHGPMSFIDGQTLVLCLFLVILSRRPYELDLIAELHAQENRQNYRDYERSIRGRSSRGASRHDGGRVARSFQNAVRNGFPSASGVPLQLAVGFRP